MSSILECKNLSVKYGSAYAVRDLNLNIERGRIIGLLGPNGSGKTTLIKTIMGLLKPSEGEVLIEGMKPSHLTKAVISYLPDNMYLDKNLKIGSIVNYFADFYEDFDADKARAMIERLSVDYNKHLKKLSKGMLEKVQLSLVMSRRAKLYVLDEPLGAVDPAAREFILNTILGEYNPYASLIISTHLIQDVEQILDEAIFIKNGSLVLHEDADSIRERTGGSLDAYFKEVFRC